MTLILIKEKPSGLKASTWCIVAIERRVAASIEEITESFWTDSHDPFDDLAGPVEYVLCRIVLVSAYSHLLKQYREDEQQEECHYDSHDGISDILYSLLDDIIFSVWKYELENSTKEWIDRSSEYDDDEYSQHRQNDVLYGCVAVHNRLLREE